MCAYILVSLHISCIVPRKYTLAQIYTEVVFIFLMHTHMSLTDDAH